MNSRPLIALSTTLVALVAALAALSGPARPANADAKAPPVDAAHLAQLKSLYSEKCSACHNLYNPSERVDTRAGWQSTVDKMLTRYHASDSISPAEAAQIVNYLATFAPKPGAQNGRGGDPWATDAVDIWTAAPAMSRVFNFVSPGALSGFGMVAAGTPGPAPLWRLAPVGASPDGTAALVRPVRPAPTRFALLVDRKDVARNLDVTVRFRIQSGKASPAVGIAFGFTSPKSYDVLLYNQARGSLSLLKIAEPAHTTLQQTPVSLPPSGPAQLTAVTPAPPARADGWHTLRLLVRDGQVRGWLDMTKRVSTQDPSYQSGKVGLWTQGDTVAAFQDWTVDIYDGATAPNGLGV